MENDDEYRPIDCHRYSQLEVSILRHWRLRMRWEDRDGVTHVETLVPLDLRTERHAEFLIARRDNGEELRIRLDRLREIEPVGEAIALWE